MNITRRGLLGMFAAGAAAAIVKPGILMPIRSIIVPREQPFALPDLKYAMRVAPAHWTDPSHVHNAWQEYGSHSHNVYDPGHRHDLVPAYGEIYTFPAGKIPPGWQLCDGSNGTPNLNALLWPVRDLAHPISLSL